jgi:anti-sigma regulatory factor (Ser/Thr protein kinase)
VASSGVLKATVVLPGLPSSVPTARHFVESILTAWGEHESAWTGALLVSELATNCTLHARTEFAIRVIRDAGRTRIEVQDASPRVPQPRAYGVHSTTGRGLQLVQGLAAHWGVQPTEDGKTVWVELAPTRGGAKEPVDDLLATDLDMDSLLAAFPDDADGPAAGRARAA